MMMVNTEQKFSRSFVRLMYFHDEEQQQTITYKRKRELRIN